jgi:O-antigen/teichoic acid export membrane protein
VSLKQKTFSAGRWTATSGFVRMALQIVQTIILARLLLPADFGLMAIAGALLAVVSLFADLGLSRAIIHYENVSDDVLSSLYWLNVSMGLGLTLLFAALAPSLALLYHQPALSAALIVVSPVFVLSSVGLQFCVLAEKDLRFATLARNEIFSSFVGFAAAVVIALRGGGVYSLICGSLVTVSTGSLLAWWRLSDRYRPRLRLRVAETLPLLRYGAYLVAENVANTVLRQADVFIGGAIASPAALGMYSMPRDLSLRLATVVNPILMRVGFPVMSRLQGDVAALKSVYLQTLRMTASVNFPAYVALGFFAPEIVALLYGARWHEAGYYLRIFAAWGLVRSVGSPVGNLLYAVGRARRAFWWNLILLMIFPPLLWFGERSNGLSGLAWTMLGLQFLIFVPSWRYLVLPACGARIGEFMAAVLTPLLLAAIAGMAAYLVASNVHQDFLRLLTGCSVGCLLYVALSLRFNKSWVSAMRTLMKLNASATPSDVS